jgi:hypothetical protein
VSTTENKQVVRNLLGTKSSRDIQALADLTIDDLTYRITGAATTSREHAINGSPRRQASCAHFSTPNTPTSSSR